MSWNTVELFLFFCLITAECIYYAFPFFYNYHVSYVLKDHPEYSTSLLYISGIFVDLGLSVSNAFVDRMLMRIGIPMTMVINAFLALFVGIVSIASTNVWVVFSVYLFAGMKHQINIFTIIFVLGNKYKENLVKYTGLIFMGSSLGFFFLGFYIEIYCQPKQSRPDSRGPL